MIVTTCVKCHASSFKKDEKSIVLSELIFFVLSISYCTT